MINNKVIHHTEDRSWWYTHGESLEGKFVALCNKFFKIDAQINPAKAENKTAPDLVVGGRLSDLKTQNTPFFTSDKYKVDPQYAVTFNRKDYERYKNLYPDIDIYFWIDWQQTELKLIKRTLNVKYMNGIYKVPFAKLAEIIEAGAPEHEYQRRVGGNGNAKSSFILDLRQFERIHESTMKLEDLFGVQPTKKEETKEIFVPLLTKFMEDEVNSEERTNDTLFRASGLGYCGRMTLYKLRGHKEVKTYQEIMTLGLGTKIHELIQDFISRMPEAVSSEETVAIEEIQNTSGHYDYLLKIGDKKYLLEIKSSNVEAYQRLSLMPIPYKAHKLQANFYMKALDVDEAIFIYVNKNTNLLSDFKKEHPEVNPVFLEIRYKYEEDLHLANKDLIEELTEHYINGTLPEYKRVSSCSYCKFIDICKEDRKKESAERRAAKKATPDE